MCLLSVRQWNNYERVTCSHFPWWQTAIQIAVLGSSVTRARVSTATCDGQVPAPKQDDAHDDSNILSRLETVSRWILNILYDSARNCDMRKKHVADVVREFLEELSKLNECKYYSEEVQHLKFLIMLFVLRKYPTRYKHNCTKKI